MRRSALFFSLILLMYTSHQTLGQDRSKRLFPRSKKSGPAKVGDTFLNQQWYLGLRWGINLTRAVPEDQFSTISPINFETEDTEKEYQDYNKIGVQIGLDFTYTWSSFALSLQPTYIRQRFAYTNQFSWTGSDGSLQLDLDQDNQLEYLELPLSFKYQFLEGPLKPFLQVGGYYGFLINANKSVVFSGTDTSPSGSNEFEREDFSVGARDLFLTSQAGVFGGIGVHYDPGNVRLTLDILYRYGLHNITDRSNRYSENRLVGVGDVLDDLTLRNISLNLGVLFPLRFLSSTFKSNG